MSPLSDQIEDLVHDTCQPKRRQIGSATDSLAEALGHDAEPVRATLAAVGGQQGIALVATSGVYFAAADSEGPVVAFPIARIAGVTPPNRTEVKLHTHDGAGILLEDFVSPSQCAQFAGLVGALIFDGPEQLVQLAADFDAGAEQQLPPLPPPPAQTQDNSTAFAGAFTAVAAVIGGISLLWLFGLSSVVIHDTEAEAQAQECQGSNDWWDCAPPMIDPTNGTYRYDCGTIGGTFSRMDNKTGTLIEGVIDEACQKQALKQGWPIGGAVFALVVAYFAIRAW